MATIKGFFFDQDGVIIDTERDGHRVAFNKTFKEFGFGFQWSVDEYHELLQIGGGKERMLHYLHTRGFGKPVSQEEEEALIKEMHHAKTDLFIQLLEKKALPLRPGIHRIMREINDLGFVLGVCTTSNQRAAKAVTGNILSDIRFDLILAGDVVTRKKPDPEIYLMAMKKTGLMPDECVVIEDSQNGVEAAKAAGMWVVATTNEYTEKEDLDRADIILSCLGNPQGEKGVLKKGDSNLEFNGVVTVRQLIDYFS